MVANGAACSQALLGELLEWSPYILALDGAFSRLHCLGIKVDAVLGDFDSIENLNELVEQQQPIEVLHKPDQEKTDLEKGLDFLVAAEHKAVNIVWASGWRTDHTLANLSNILKYKHLITINVIDDYSRLYVLPQSFKKHYVQNTKLSLFPMGEVTGISTENLNFGLHNESLQIGGRIGTSNAVTHDGLVCITHKTGHLLLIEVME